MFCAAARTVRGVGVALAIPEGPLFRHAGRQPRVEPWKAIRRRRPQKASRRSRNPPASAPGPGHALGVRRPCSRRSARCGARDPCCAHSGAPERMFRPSGRGGMVRGMWDNPHPHERVGYLGTSARASAAGPNPLPPVRLLHFIIFYFMFYKYFIIQYEFSVVPKSPHPFPRWEWRLPPSYRNQFGRPWAHRDGRQGGRDAIRRDGQHQDRRVADAQACRGPRLRQRLGSRQPDDLVGLLCGAGPGGGEHLPHPARHRRRDPGEPDWRR